MKKILIVLCLCVITLSGCNSSQQEYVNRSLVVAGNATSYFQNRNDKQFYLLLDSNLKDRLTEEELSSELDNIVRIYGKVKEISTDNTSYVNKDSELEVKVPVRFTSGWMDFQYSINESGSITGFKIVSSEMLDESGYKETKGTYEFSDYSETYVYTEPKAINEKTPILIMIHGKDAFDRNSTVGVNRVFRSLAYQLADNKIASVRYDRIVSSYEVDDSKELILEELQAVLKALKNDKLLEEHPIYLFGYGIGGYLMPYLANQISGDGYIIANAPAENIAQGFYDEKIYLIDLDTSYDDEDKVTKKKEAKATLDIINSLSSPNDYTRKLFGYTSSFWLGIKNYDALSLVKSIKKPVMVIAGSNDYEVSTESYNAWVQALSDNKSADLKFYKDLDHLFIVRHTQSKPADSLTEGTLSPALIKDLVSFVQSE